MSILSLIRISLSQRAIGISVPSILLLGMIIVDCSKDEVGEIHRQEGVLSVIDYIHLMSKIDGIENEIRQHPTDAELRAKLVAVCVDTVSAVIRAVGHGIPTQQSRSRALALQSAERAAIVDAYRWIAYLMKWKENPAFPDYGAIQAKVPALQIVLKDTLQNNEVRLLVETDEL